MEISGSFRQWGQRGTHWLFIPQFSVVVPRTSSAQVMSCLFTWPAFSPQLRNLYFSCSFILIFSTGWIPRPTHSFLIFPPFPLLSSHPPLPLLSSQDIPHPSRETCLLYIILKVCCVLFLFILINFLENWICICLFSHSPFPSWEQDSLSVACLVAPHPFFSDLNVYSIMWLHDQRGFPHVNKNNTEATFNWIAFFLLSRRGTQIFAKALRI